MTFRHRAGVSPYTSAFAFAETCVFVKQSPGPFHCGLHCCRHPFFRSYGVNMPSSLTTLLPLALGFSPHLPVSVYGTGTHETIAAFLGSWLTRFSTNVRSTSRFTFLTRIFLCDCYTLVPAFPFPARALLLRPRSSVHKQYRNFNLLSIDYDFRPRLRPRLTQGRSALPWKP